MSTPQQQGSRGPRRSGKKPRPSDVNDENGAASAVPQKTSPNSAARENNTKNSNKGQPRRPSHAQNKYSNDGNLSDRARHHSQVDKAKATPVKPAAYAGATFQQSPAASALPLPSFYSKSLPNTTSIPDQLSQQASPPLPTSGTPGQDTPTKRESTPLDFLFEAARKASATPRGESPAARPGNLSIPSGSPVSRSPAPREGESMFPFELEGAPTPGEDGTAFATPYKDRIAAFKSTKSTAHGGAKVMDENERRAKSEALKQFLMNSGAPDTQAPTGLSDANNPFNARPPFQPSGFLPHGPPGIRQHSNSSTSYFPREPRDYNPPQGFPPMAYHYPPSASQTPKRPASSNLRNVYQSEPEYAELSSDSAVTPPISTARKQTTQSLPQMPQQQARYGATSAGQPYSPQPQLPTHRSKPSAQQLEDDLRRVLKLDLVSRG